jgi:hypothetical protein
MGLLHEMVLLPPSAGDCNHDNNGTTLKKRPYYHIELVIATMKTMVSLEFGPKKIVQGAKHTKI